jgi:hypothetical protein
MGFSILTSRLHLDCPASTYSPGGIKAQGFKRLLESLGRRNLSAIQVDDFDSFDSRLLAGKELQDLIMARRSCRGMNPSQAKMRLNRVSIKHITQILGGMFLSSEISIGTKNKHTTSHVRKSRIRYNMMRNKIPLHASPLLRSDYSRRKTQDQHHFRTALRLSSEKYQGILKKIY